MACSRCSRFCGRYSYLSGGCLGIGNKFTWTCSFDETVDDILLGYGPTQIPLAIAEAIFTALVLEAMVKRRPDLLPGVLREKEAK